MQHSLQPREADTRAAARTSLYLTATLYSDGSALPVRIRNISSAGALLDGAVLPAAGAVVQLTRGQLVVHALVVWTAGSRCGLKFSGMIDVPQWRAASGNCEQQRVDDVVRLVKAGAVPLPVPEHGKEPAGWAESPQQLAGDLRRVTELLDELGEMLASSPDIIVRHGPVLQNLDIAMQVIAAVQAIVGGRHGGDVDAARLVGLRRSADQALLRGS